MNMSETSVEGVYVNDDGEMVYYLKTPEYAGVYHIAGISQQDLPNNEEEICLILMMG
jgi:hypothetical protein